MFGDEWVDVLPCLLKEHRPSQNWQDVVLFFPVGDGVGKNFYYLEGLGLRLRVCACIWMRACVCVCVWTGGIKSMLSKTVVISL